MSEATPRTREREKNKENFDAKARRLHVLVQSRAAGHKRVATGLHARRPPLKRARSAPPAPVASEPRAVSAAPAVAPRPTPFTRFTVERKSKGRVPTGVAGGAPVGGGMRRAHALSNVLNTRARRVKRRETVAHESEAFGRAAAVVKEAVHATGDAPHEEELVFHALPRLDATPRASVQWESEHSLEWCRMLRGGEVSAALMRGGAGEAGLEPAAPSTRDDRTALARALLVYAFPAGPLPITAALAAHLRDAEQASDDAAAAMTRFVHDRWASYERALHSVFAMYRCGACERFYVSAPDKQHSVVFSREDGKCVAVMHSPQLHNTLAEGEHYTSIGTLRHDGVTRRVVRVHDVGALIDVLANNDRVMRDVPTITAPVPFVGATVRQLSVACTTTRVENRTRYFATVSGAAVLPRAIEAMWRLLVRTQRGSLAAQLKTDALAAPLCHMRDGDVDKGTVLRVEAMPRGAVRVRIERPVVRRATTRKPVFLE